MFYQIIIFRNLSLTQQYIKSVAIIAFDVMTLTEIQYTLSILQVYFVCTSKKKSTIEVYFIHTSRKKSINEVYFLDVLHLYLKYYSILQVYFFNLSILQVYFET